MKRVGKIGDDGQRVECMKLILRRDVFIVNGIVQGRDYGIRGCDRMVGMINGEVKRSLRICEVRVWV